MGEYTHIRISDPVKNTDPSKYTVIHFFSVMGYDPVNTYTTQFENPVNTELLCKPALKAKNMLESLQKCITIV